MYDPTSYCIVNDLASELEKYSRISIRGRRETGPTANHLQVPRLLVQTLPPTPTGFSKQDFARIFEQNIQQAIGQAGLDLHVRPAWFHGSSQ